MEIRSDLEKRGSILLDEDIGAVLDGDKRDIRLLDARDLAGSAQVIYIGPGVRILLFLHIITQFLSISVGGPGGMNREGAVFVEKQKIWEMIFFVGWFIDFFAFPSVSDSQESPGRHVPRPRRASVPDVPAVPGHRR